MIKKSFIFIILVLTLSLTSKVFASSDIEVLIKAITNDDEITIFNKSVLYGTNFQVESSETDFVFWIVDGILEEERLSKTTFKAVRDFNAYAIYASSEFVVIYVDYSGKLISYHHTSDVSLVSDPTNLPDKIGYVTNGFETTEYNGHEVRRLRYVRDQESFVKVNGDDYLFNSVVTMENSLSDFTHYEDSKGNVLSYLSNYQFSALSDFDVVASSGRDKTDLVTLRHLDDYRNNHQSFLGYIELLAGNELVEFGLELNGNKRRASILNEFTNEFLISIRDELSIDTIRAYVSFNEGGTIKTIYSDYVAVGSFVEVNYHNVNLAINNNSRIILANSELADPVMNGYLFKGWYTNKSLTNLFDGELTNEINLYAKWEKEITATSVELVESFANIGDAKSSYNSGSFVSDNGLSWNYVGMRNDQTLDGKALAFGDSSANNLKTNVLGGLSYFSIDTINIFSGSNTRKLALYVNGVKAFEFESTSIRKTHVFENLTYSGELELEIRNIGGLRVVVDNIVIKTLGTGNDTLGPEIFGLKDLTIGLDVTTLDLLKELYVIDNFDGDVTSKLSYESNIIFGIEGSYQVNYSITDSLGNETNATINIKIVDYDLINVDGEFNDLVYSINDHNIDLFKGIVITNYLGENINNLVETLIYDENLNLVSELSLGEFYLEYYYNDTIIGTRFVELIDGDIIAPIISALYNELTYDIKSDSIPQSDSEWISAFGVSVTDNVSMNLEVVILDSDFVLLEGIYYIVFGASDEAGNNALEYEVTLEIISNEVELVETVYEFSSANFNAIKTVNGVVENGDWLLGKAGNGFISGQGMQFSTGSSGGNGTSEEFVNIYSIEIFYATNSSKGAGTIVTKIANNVVDTFTVSTNGGTTPRSAGVINVNNLSGSINIQVNTQTNSIYLHSVKVVGSSKPIILEPTQPVFNSDISNVINLRVGQIFVPPILKAYDHNGDVLVEIVYNDVNINEAGSYAILYQAVNDLGLSQLVITVIVTDGPTYDGYYESASGLSGNALLLELRYIISSGVKSTSYDDAKVILEYSDRDPNNSKNVLQIYNRGSVVGKWNGSSLPWNREHVWPQSLLGSASKSDPHNLRPADPNINSSRGNLKFVAGSGSYGKSGNGWYPGSDDRGDVARIVFYMVTRYSNLNITTIGNLQTFIEWHQADPVDDFERNRNDVIYTYTKNRNPYIDNPDFVFEIWS